MEVSVDSAKRVPPIRLETALSLGLGVVLGVVARDLPIAVATLVFPTDRDRSCDDAPIECAIESAPDVIGGLVVFGFLVLCIAALIASVGALLVARGIHRGTSRTCDDPGADGTAPEARSITQRAQLIAGTALIVPAVWLVAAFVTSL